MCPLSPRKPSCGRPYLKTSSTYTWDSRWIGWARLTQQENGTTPVISPLPTPLAARPPFYFDTIHIYSSQSDGYSGVLASSRASPRLHLGWRFSECSLVPSSFTMLPPAITPDLALYKLANLVELLDRGTNGPCALQTTREHTQVPWPGSDRRSVIMRSDCYVSFQDEADLRALAHRDTRRERL